MPHRPFGRWPQAALCLAATLMLAAPGCASYPALPGGSVASRFVGQGPARATVRVKPAAFKTLATVRALGVDDVFTLRITLWRRDAEDVFTAMTTPEPIVLDLKADPYTLGASFEGLPHGYYQVRVSAYGDPAADPASPLLNQQPGTADLDLRVDLSAEATAQLTLDPVILDATGTATIQRPTNDGDFEAAGPEEIEVVDPDPADTGDL